MRRLHHTTLVVASCLFGIFSCSSSKQQSKAPSQTAASTPTSQAKDASLPDENQIEPEGKHDGMEVICNAPNKVTLTGDAAEDFFKMNQYIRSNLKNRELIEFYSTYGLQEPQVISGLLDEKAKAANLPSCALARWWATDKPARAKAD